MIIQLSSKASSVEPAQCEVQTGCAALRRPRRAARSTWRCFRAALLGRRMRSAPRCYGAHKFPLPLLAPILSRLT